jgi:rhodanese-related sulfurtransferase
MKKLSLNMFLSSILLLSLGCSAQENIVLDPYQEDLAYSQASSSKLDSDEITVSDAFNIYNKKTHIFIDVREQDEYDEVHMKNVKFIPLATLEGQLPKLSKTEQYVTVCRSGRRSKAAALKMKEKGFKVVSMAGGMLDWEAKGYPVERSRGK